MSTIVRGEGAGGGLLEEGCGQMEAEAGFGAHSASIPAGVSGGAPDFLRTGPSSPPLPVAALHLARDPGFQLWRRDWLGGSYPAWPGMAGCLPGAVREVVFPRHDGSVAGRR